MVSDSYIQIDEHRASRKRMIPYRIRFELDRDNLSQIDTFRQNNEQIQLSSDRLTNIRYYALLVFHAKDGSELIFTTNYLQEQKQKTVIQSAIAASGRISQQIQEDSLHNPKLFNSIIKAHHWSISQITTQLPLKSYSFSKWLPEIIALLITIIIAPIVIYFIPIFSLFKLLIIFIILLLLYLLFKHILITKLKKLVLYQLLFGWLAGSLKKRKIGLILLSILRVSFKS